MKQRSLFISLLLGLLLFNALPAEELVILEAFSSSDHKAFTDMYSAFECNVDTSGAVWIHYSLTRDDSWPQFIVTRYSPGQGSQTSELGAYYGIGGWYDPVVCRLDGTTMVSQVFVSNDYGRKKQYHELTSLNYSADKFKRVQYPGGASNTSLLHVRKMTDTTASSFSMDWDKNGDPVSVKFLNNFALYPLWPDDYDGPFLETDTLWVSSTLATFVYDERLPKSDFMAAVYRHWEDEYWKFACVNNEKVLFEDADILASDIENLQLHTTKTQFVLSWRDANQSVLSYVTYTPGTNNLSQPVSYYTSPADSLESLKHHEVVMDEKNIYLQFPLLKTAGKSESTQWSAIVRHTITRSELAISKSDTLISFTGPQAFSAHRLTCKSGSAHSLLVTNDGQMSQLLYSGPIDL